MKKALFPVNPWAPKLLFQSLKFAKERKISANKTQTVRNENIKKFFIDLIDAKPFISPHKCL